MHHGVHKTTLRGVLYCVSSYVQEGLQQRCDRHEETDTELSVLKRECASLRAANSTNAKEIEQMVCCYEHLSTFELGVCLLMTCMRLHVITAMIPNTIAQTCEHCVTSVLCLACHS